MRADHLCATLALLLVCATPCAAQQIELREAFPLRGANETLTVENADGTPVAGAVVTVTYRPNSQTARVRELAPTDAAGQTQWTVEDAGLATLAAKSASGEALTSRNVAVRFGGMPGSGVAVMVIAGVLLFGGALLGMILLLREPSHAPEHEPPST